MVLCFFIHFTNLVQDYNLYDFDVGVLNKIIILISLNFGYGFKNRYVYV
jgi:hypothetical protein